MRHQRNARSRCIFAPAEIQFSRGIDGVNCFYGEVHGKTMHLIFRMNNSRNMFRGVFSGQKLHVTDYIEIISGRPHWPHVHAAKRTALKRSYLLSGTSVPACIPRSAVCAPGKFFGHARSTDGKSKPIFPAE